MKLLKFEIFNTIFILILGSILHFTFEWSGNNVLVGTFSAVNESTWEHLKLIFFPMTITSIVGYFYFNRTNPNYLCSKVFATLLSMAFIVIAFYTYTGVIGTRFTFIDISLFFLATFLGEYITYKKVVSNCTCNTSVSIMILILLILCFILFTFTPPKINLFLDPITKTYSIK